MAPSAFRSDAPGEHQDSPIAVLNRRTISPAWLRCLLAAVAFGLSMWHPSGEVFADLLLYNQGFEQNTLTWSDANSVPPWAGQIDRVASGSGGVNSAEGSFHAIVSEGPHPTAPAFNTAPFTNFGGYRTQWNGGWMTSTQVYLDPSWSNGWGFDFSVAATRADGNFLRDFIFHVARDANGLWVSGSNTSNWASSGNRLKINQASNPWQVQTAGWYTLEHVFREQAGTLAVDLNFYDSGNSLLWSTTRNNLNDAIPLVGGNRYGWFTVVTVANGLHVDNVSLISAIPEPGVAVVLLLVTSCSMARRRR